MDQSGALYLAIADQLRQQIVNGELAPGAALPSQTEIARQFGVSDGVARKVIRTLVVEGHAVARPGAGTFVRERPTLRRLVRSWHRSLRGGSPFAAEMRAQGVNGGWQYSSHTETAPPAVRQRLLLPETDNGPDAIRTDYVFTADDEPVMLSTSWEPFALTKGTPIVLPEDGPYAGRGVVERMMAIGIRITHSAEAVSARMVLTTEATRLRTAPGSIVLTIERTYWADEQPVETADIVIPVDRYQVIYGTAIDEIPQT
ncbi:GntR family transcriptional regulator [Streptosporangium sp. NPDC000239]|uniref:GntR family transcriptional regulator n=1 Tax=Streptosporangium sp. NPDC000239 TaxID=3154248 RepID=UPI0033182575